MEEDGPLVSAAFLLSRAFAEVGTLGERMKRVEAALSLTPTSDFARNPSEMDGLRAKVSSLEDENRIVTESASNLDAKYRQLLAELEECRASAVKSEDALRQLSVEKTSLNAHSEVLQGKIDHLLKRQHDLEQESTHWQTKCDAGAAALTAALEEAKVALNSQKAQAEDETARAVAAAKSEASELKVKECETLQLSLEETRQALESARRNAQELGEKSAKASETLDSRCAALNSRAEEAEAEVGSLTSKLSAAMNRLEEEMGARQRAEAAALASERRIEALECAAKEAAAFHAAAEVELCKKFENEAAIKQKEFQEAQIKRKAIEEEAAMRQKVMEETAMKQKELEEADKKKKLIEEAAKKQKEIEEAAQASLLEESQRREETLKAELAAAAQAEAHAQQMAFELQAAAAASREAERERAESERKQAEAEAQLERGRAAIEAATPATASPVSPAPPSTSAVSEIHTLHKRAILSFYSKHKPEFANEAKVNELWAKLNVNLWPALVDKYSLKLVAEEIHAVAAPLPNESHPDLGAKFAPLRDAVAALREI